MLLRSPDARLPVLQETPVAFGMQFGILHWQGSCQQLRCPVPRRPRCDGIRQGTAVVPVRRAERRRYHGLCGRTLGWNLRSGRIQHGRFRPRFRIVGTRARRVRLANIRPRRRHGHRCHLRCWTRCRCSGCDANLQGRRHDILSQLPRLPESQETKAHVQVFLRWVPGGRIHRIRTLRQVHRSRPDGGKSNFDDVPFHIRRWRWRRS
mmetsp:Transcript_19035/g.54057  ORF Transcript_19035/g.54057 Transcript_19035/m.54057 type:complete len:207 (+) Transcript_19035:862-1482(+)